MLFNFDYAHHNSYELLSTGPKIPLVHVSYFESCPYELNILLTTYLFSGWILRL